MYATATPSRIKTARQLGLRVSYYKGLWEVLYLLESGGLKFCLMGRSAKGNCFNMNTWHDRHKCGSVGCIGGWAAHLSGARWFSGEDYESNMVLSRVSSHQEQQFHNLLYPSDVEVWDKITPKRAAKTLRGYLETGVTNWT
jgi:hypothetical protein